MQYFTTPGSWYMGNLVCKSHRYWVVIEEGALWVEDALRNHFGNDITQVLGRLVTFFLRGSPETNQRLQLNEICVVVCCFNHSVVSNSL